MKDPKNYKAPFVRTESKDAHITPQVVEYVDGLLRSGERADVLALLSEHDKGDRAYLHVPYVEGRFLEAFTAAVGAKKVLEIGTFKGYSTVFFARALPGDPDVEVVTLDEDKRYVDEAQTFWKHMNVEQKIKFKLGLAEETLKNMLEHEEKFLEYFDLVFIDADKENYKTYFEYVLKLTRKGGSILLDNVLWRGLVADEAATSHDKNPKHLREFNAWLFSEYGLQAALLPAWDGLTLVVKK